MAEFFKTIWGYILEFLSQYSFFISGYYYGELFRRYFSVGGFILGFVFVLILYFSSAEEQSKAGFFKVVPIIAVINSCMVLTNLLNRAFHTGDLQLDLFGTMNGADNIISGFVLTLVLSSCYRGYPGQAFLFGLATYTAVPFMNFVHLGQFPPSLLLGMGVRIIISSLLCIIISKRKYFYTGWIWYFSCHILFRITGNVLNILLEDLLRHEPVQVMPIVNGVLSSLPRYTLDVSVFAVVLVFAIVFEKGVLKKRVRRRTA